MGCPLFAEEAEPLDGEGDVFQGQGFAEEGGYLAVSEACDAATYTCYQKTVTGMCLGISDKVCNVGFYSLHAAMHGGYGVTSSGGTDAYAPFGSETVVSHAGCPAAVHALEVASEHKYLVIG